MHRVAFPVDDLEQALATAAVHSHPLRGVATSEDVHTRTSAPAPGDVRG